MRRGKKDLTRREFLRLAGATATGLAFCPWLPGCSPSMVAQGIDGLEEAGLSLGCAAGEVTSKEAVIWLRARNEGLASVHYGNDPSLEEFVATRPVKISTESDFTAKIPIDRLEPKTAYFYRAAVAGKRPGPVSRFVTAPHPDDPADVRFAFSGDSRESYQPFSIMDSIRAKRPDFFVHLGDTIYADRDGVASRLPEFWAKYVANRRDPPTQRLFSDTGLYVIWDDHEVADNYDPGHPLIPIGRKAFFDYWPVLQNPQAPDRLYRSFRWGKAVELFILDTRQYRDPQKGTILGAEQREWFLEALASSTAYFKFIATPVPFSSPSRDKWGGFRKERDEVRKLIRDKRLRGAVFIAADVHYAAVSRVGGGSGSKEIIVGPLGAPVGLALGTPRRFEFFSRESFSYGLASIHAQARPPYAELEILDQNNGVLYRTRIDSLTG